MRDVRGFKTLCEAETLMTQASSRDRSDPGLDPGSARPAGASCPASPSSVPPALNRLMTPQYWLTNDTCRVWSSVARIALSQATCLKPGPINVRACSQIFNHHSSLRMHL